MMFEKIDRRDLIPDELYFLKCPISNITICKARMIRYLNISYEEVSCIFDDPIYGMCLIELHPWSCYRYVSSEEYKEKVRENMIQHL